MNAVDSSAAQCSKFSTLSMERLFLLSERASCRQIQRITCLAVFKTQRQTLQACRSRCFPGHLAQSVQENGSRSHKADFSTFSPPLSSCLSCLDVSHVCTHTHTHCAWSQLHSLSISIIPIAMLPGDTLFMQFSVENNYMSSHTHQCERTELDITDTYICTSIRSMRHNLLTQSGVFLLFQTIIPCCEMLHVSSDRCAVLLVFVRACVCMCVYTCLSKAHCRAAVNPRHW